VPCPYAGLAMRNDVRDFLGSMEEKRPGTQFINFKTALEIILGLGIFLIYRRGCARSAGKLRWEGFAGFASFIRRKLSMFPLSSSSSRS